MIRGDLVAAPRAVRHVAEAAPVAREVHRLTHAERAVLGEVQRCMMGKPFSFPRQRMLAKATGYSPRAVKGAVAGLRQKGRLVVKRVSELTEAERLMVACAGASRSHKTAHRDHRFRPMPIAQNGASRSPIPADADHTKRRIAIT